MERLAQILAVDPLPLLALSAACLLTGLLVGVTWMALALRRDRSALRRDLAEQQRRVIKGQVAEQFAPWLPGFPFRPSECLFLGKPVDLLVLEGRDAGEIAKVVFLEIKTGEARPSRIERSLQDCIAAGRVEYRIWRLRTQP